MSQPEHILDLYERLGVSPRAPSAVIFGAYSALSRTSYGESHTALLEAYNTLSNEERRLAYDQSRNNLLGGMVGQYRILSHIATGGFGKTYRAQHTRLGTFACIKHCSLISPEADAVLEREARAMWKLTHYGIPAIRELVRLDDGTSALIMDFIEGHTLMEFVEKHGRMDPKDVAWILDRLLNVLYCAHVHGVVHGDVKPKNTILQENHSAFLVDFGLAMIDPRATDRNAGFTKIFSPPEQVEGEPLLPETDLYALGMTAIYALSGSLEHTKKREIPDDRTIPKPLRDFVAQLTASDILDRPHWGTVNLCKEFSLVREKAFGQSGSGMKPLVY